MQSAVMFFGLAAGDPAGGVEVDSELLPRLWACLGLHAWLPGVSRCVLIGARACPEWAVWLHVWSRCVFFLLADELSLSALLTARCALVCALDFKSVSSMGQ